MHFQVGQQAISEAARRGDGLLVRSFKRCFDKQRLRRSYYRRTLRSTGEYDFVEEGDRVEVVDERVIVDPDEYSRPEVIAAGARLLHYLLTRAELDADTSGATPPPADVLSAVDAGTDEILHIGVPVSFGPTARRRLLQALVATGCFGKGETAYARALRRCRFVYEPLALMSTLQLFEEKQNVLVFDFGGGTLDIAIVEVEQDDGPSPATASSLLEAAPVLETRSTNASAKHSSPVERLYARRTRARSRASPIGTFFGRKTPSPVPRSASRTSRPQISRSSTSPSRARNSRRRSRQNSTEPSQPSTTRCCAPN